MPDKIVGTCRRCKEPVKEDSAGNRSCRNGCDQFTAAPTGTPFLSNVNPDYKNKVDGGISMHFRAGVFKDKS